MPEVSDALARMRGRRALLVGDLVLDSYIYGQTVRVSREAPVLVVRRERAEHRLGGAANTAANLTALGLHTEVVGTVGADRDGGRLLGMLQEVGADVGAVLQTDGATAVKTRILAGAFGTSRQQVLRLDEEPEPALPTSVDHELVQSVERRAADADVVVVSDYGTGVVTDAVAAMVLKLAAAGKIVCVDSRYRLSELGRVTAVTPNIPEAEAALGAAIDDAEAVQRAGASLVERLGCGACLLTQGRAGMTLFRPDAEPSHVDIVGDEEVTDVTGAGDTVIATFAAALAAGLGMVNGMRLANCAAGLVVTRVGTAAARPEEITAAAEKAALSMLAWDG